MEVERQKIVDLLNNIQKIQEKIHYYNKARERDETYFYLDRIAVELRLLYCDCRDILISDPFLRQKYMEQKVLYQPKNSTQLD